MTTAVLLDGARTPFGRFTRGLAALSARDLGAAAVAELLRRTPELGHADGALLGSVLQGGQGQNPARQIAASGGLDPAVPAITLNNVCLAGLAAVADATRRVRLGEGSSYLVGGADSMSRGRHAALLREGVPRPGPVELVDTTVTDGLWCALGDEGMGPLSERANTALGIGRAEQDQLAARSQQLAAAARDAGRLAEEIVPVTTPGGEVRHDEGIRDGVTVESLAGLRPVFAEAGTITAGNASQMSDGASVGVVASLARAEALGRVPLARVTGYAEVAGPDTSLHLKPAAAIRAALDRAGLAIGDVDLLEINEAFAGVVAASVRELSVPLDIVNVNGGAIALGHPLGGTGFRLALTLAHELRRRDARVGVAALCGGGGQGAAVVLERVDR
ncbi:acetyl-CoA C-acyltransferase [Ornithinicoccus halotolerans]|uniref:acetyl-CoA C-acyltransferase n=1 Tax=Ornithinicoccus halotolerans TaxID=1748220 RepID=UPI0012955C46|nr:acetyl-CoA C-acyltransferase [Ornithinicoccus halotolerans]